MEGLSHGRAAGDAVLPGGRKAYNLRMEMAEQALNLASVEVGDHLHLDAQDVLRCGSQDALQRLQHKNLEIMNSEV